MKSTLASRMRDCWYPRGAMVNATSSSSELTKNQEQSRDPQMHQTRKGKQWYFA
jgi:hypothetical protein